MPTRVTRVFLSLLLLSSVAVCQRSGDVRPEKVAFKDVKNWSATNPGDVHLKNFRPFRAVYERNYLQHGGPNAGDLRVD